VAGRRAAGKLLAGVSRGAGPAAASAAEAGGGGRHDGVTGTKRRPNEEQESEGGSASDEDAACAGARATTGAVDALDPLDPLARHAAHLAPPALPSSALAAGSPVAHEPVRARSLEELLPALVRRIAWAGDRHKGTVRLELGAGAYAGTTVTVHTDAGRVRVELGGCEGPELDRLRARLEARLRGHGLDVESVT
jgi:hypothetical protein